MQSHAAVAESWNEVLQWALIRSSWLGINWNTLAAKMSQNQEEHVIIDLNESGPIHPSELQFEDFHSLDPALQGGAIATEHIEPDDSSHASDQAELLGSAEKNTSEATSHSWVSLLMLDYYQGFFDVTSTQVAHRVLAGMLPLRQSLVQVLRPNPDLYGPFWLCMTLIFTTAISGNISRVFSEEKDWEFHFHEVTILGSVVYAYTWLVPLLLWALLWWRGSRDRYTLLELLSVYGYCIAIFIPITVLWVIHSEVLRWLLLCVGAGLSGTVLVLALWVPLKADSKKLATAVLAVVTIMHVGLAVGFKFYYFSSALAPEDSTQAHAIVTNHTLAKS